MIQDFIKKLIPKATEDYLPGDSIRNSSGIVCINCIGCSKQPNPCYDACIRCMCLATQKHGTCERIRLCGIKDIEVCGNAASQICSLSSAMHIPSSTQRHQACRNCQCTPEAVMTQIWGVFPEFGFSTGRNMIHNNPGLEECQTCVNRTEYLISNAEKNINKLAETIYQNQEAES